MKLKRILFKSLLFGVLFFTPIDIIVKNKEITKISKVYAINPLDFQHMKGFSSWYENLDHYNLIDDFISEHKIPADLEINPSEKDSLLEIIKHYSIVAFNLEEYKSRIYPEFIRLNEALQKRKAKLEFYELLKFDEQHYFVKNDAAVKLNDDILEIIKKHKGYIENLENFRRKYPNEDYYNAATTLLNLSGFLPFIKKFEAGLDEEGILGLISSESLGYQLIGGSGDIGLFQLYPETIRRIYDGLKNDKSKIDSSYKYLSKADTIDFETFNKSVSENSLCNLEAGFYWLKKLNETAENEVHLVLLYHLGQNNFSLLPKKIKNRIFNEEIKSYNDINDNELKYRGMRYLYHYLAKKECFVFLRDLYIMDDSI